MAAARSAPPIGMVDIAFLIRHDGLTPAQIENALAEAVIPDLPELREAFERAKPRVRELARASGGALSSDQSVHH